MAELDEEERYVLRLDEHEVANLKWLVETIRNKLEYADLDNGDWLADIEDALDEADTEIEPNGKKSWR